MADDPAPAAPAARAKSVSAALRVGVARNASGDDTGDKKRSKSAIVGHFRRLAL
jgi:hypothetical protein